MKVEIKELEKNRVCMDVEVPQEDTLKEREEIYTYLSGRAKVPGFRSGKIPRDVLEKNFEGTVRKEIIERLIPKNFQQAVKDHNITPLTTPKFSDVSFETGKPLKFKATFETKPEIEIKDYRNIELKKTLVEVSDEEVDAKLKEIQMQTSTFKAVEGRDTAGIGDIAAIDFQGTLGGKPMSGWSKKNTLVEVGREAIVPGFTKEIEGMKKGTAKEAEISFPADFNIEGLRNKKAIFKITLNDLKERKLAPINDDMAKDFGFENISVLKEKITEQVKKSKEEMEQRKLIDQMVDKLVAGTKIDIPSTLIEQQRNYMMYKLNSDLAQKKISLENYLQANNLTEEKLKEMYTEAAVKQLKATLIIGEISKKESIKVEEEDIKKEIDALSMSTKQKPEQIRRQLEQRNLFDNLCEDILERKVIDFLFKNAKVIEKPKSFWGGIGNMFKKEEKIKK